MVQIIGGIHMKGMSLCLALVLLLSSSSFSQKVDPKLDRDIAAQRLALASDLRNLAFEIPRIDGSLARALAGAEIADGVWTLDRAWAKTLLREAFQLTYPSDEELAKSPPRPAGAEPIQPTQTDQARDDLRSRIFSVANRDRAFADQLMRESSKYIGRYEQQTIYSALARTALDAGDNQTAIPLVQQAIEADPTQLTFTDLVNDLATKDRAAADKLILQIIHSLRALQLNSRNAGRAYFSLLWVIYPNSIFPDPNKRVPDPGPAVMRAYVSYIVDSLSTLEQREPGSLKLMRSTLLSAWLPLKAYAPEFTSPFMQLEALSRMPGKDASLPTQTYEEADKERFRKKDSEALSSDEPDDRSIQSVIGREDFETARKLISNLKDGDRKTQFTEQLHSKEAISLANKGDLIGAQSLAERLTKTNSMLQVYPLIVARYAANKDQVGASAATHQAMRQLKNANSKPSGTPPFGMPAAFMLSAREMDPLLSGLVKLANAVLPVDSLLAAEVVDEMVDVANRSELDTKQGRTGFENDVFSKLADKDEIRARSAAENLKDRLRRIVALAAIYKWKAKQFEKQNPDKAVRLGQGTVR
jgi:hypothetical protein